MKAEALSYFSIFFGSWAIRKYILFYCRQWVLRRKYWQQMPENLFLDIWQWWVHCLQLHHLSFLVWAHHMFVTGLNPFLGSFFVLLTLLIAVPSAIKVFNWLTTLWKANIRFTPGMLFSIGFVSLFISGGLTGIFLGNSALDIHLHDTYFVVAHFHIVMGVASMFGMFAGIYHWFPKMFGRYLNNTLAYIHFWVTIMGAYLIFWPLHYEGLAGMPRRYYDVSNWESFKMFAGLNEFISVVALIVFATQLLFIIKFRLFNI